MPKKIYDIGKWVLLTLVPAAITLVTALGNIYGFDTTVIVATVSAVATFAGTILGIDSVYYAKQKEVESKEGDGK